MQTAPSPRGRYAKKVKTIQNKAYSLITNYQQEFSINTGIITDFKVVTFPISYQAAQYAFFSLIPFLHLLLLSPLLVVLSSACFKRLVD